MTPKNSITFLLALAFILNCQPSIAAQNGEQRGDAATGQNNRLRLAQDYFHSVKKTATSPFAPPASPSLPNVKTVGTNLRSFGVPFKVNAEDESFIEVQLYMSRDMGRTWKFHARQTTDKQDFPFQAVEDGEYWFSLKTLNRDRRLVPEGDPQAELKIVVDTVKPTLDFRIETDAAGRVVCRWQAQDKNLAPESLQIYYQPTTQAVPAKDWIKVPVNLKGTARVGVYADQIAWWPETTEQALNVAVEIRDIADNVVQVERQVIVPQTAWRHRSQSTAQITDSRIGEMQHGSQFAPAPKSEPDQKTAQNSTHYRPNVVCKDGVCMPAPAQPGLNNATDQTLKKAQLVGSEVEFVDPPMPNGNPGTQPPTTMQSNNSAGRGSIVWQSDSENWGHQNQSSIGSTMGPDSTLAPQFNPRQSVSRPVTDVPSNPSTMTYRDDQVIGESSTMGKSNQYRGLNSQVGSTIPRPTLLPDVPGQYPNTGHPGFERIGSSDRASAAGAGRWSQPGTRATSNRFSNAGFADAPDAATQDATTNLVGPRSRAPLQIIGSKRFRLDYGIDSIDPSGVAKVDLWMTRDDGKTWSTWGSDPDSQSPFPVEVQEEGLYGFRVVVHSKDGLTGQGPSSGDDADMWITVDTKSPLTRITSVPYGRGNEAGRLVINYSVADSALTLRAITLGYSPSPTGPWSIIEEGLRNEGRYVWKPQSNVPDRIFLRIEALDKAGNVGVHVLSHAIDVSGLVPRGTIHGVTPVGSY